MYLIGLKFAKDIISKLNRKIGWNPRHPIHQYITESWKTIMILLQTLNPPELKWWKQEGQVITDISHLFSWVCKVQLQLQMSRHPMDAFPDVNIESWWIWWFTAILVGVGLLKIVLG